MSSPQSTIATVELFLISIPFSARRRTSGEESIDEFNASSQTFTEMESLMVRVTDSSGLQGWGEAFGHKTNPASWAALESIVGPYSVGRPADPAEFRTGAEYAFHAFGRTGPVHYAVSAIDTALWDIAAQRQGLPLRHLLAQRLGATAHDTIDTYASLVHYGEDPAEVAHHVGRAKDLGFTAFKLHESTVPAAQAARDAAGTEAALMTDVNCHWSHPDDADAAMSALKDVNLLWMEEPIFPPDDHEALARLNNVYGTIAAGENASGTEDLIRMMSSGAVQYAQPSVGKIGGVSAMLEVIEAGRQHGVVVAPHCFYYGPALQATAEIVGALGPEVRLEVPFLHWEAQLHPLHGAGPRITLSDAPGLGFAPDLQVLQDHVVKTAKLPH